MWMPPHIWSCVLNFLSSILSFSVNQKHLKKVKGCICMAIKICSLLACLKMWIAFEILALFWKLLVVLHN